MHSILTQYEDISAFSGSTSECRHHMIFGSGVRKLAEEDGLWIPLTHKEHNMSPEGLIMQIHGNPTAEKLSKICGQLAWEKQAILDGHTDEEARNAFIRRYGISYL